MQKNKPVKDIRSTGRRRARRALFRSRVDFKCADCGKTNIEPPKDAPNYFEEIWPDEKRVLTGSGLQADHETKDLDNNDVQNLNWRCPSCHKIRDSQTEKGESTVSNFNAPVPYLQPETVEGHLAVLNEDWW